MNTAFSRSFLVLLLIAALGGVSAAETDISTDESPRISVAVLALKPTSGVSEGESAVITDRLRVELFRTGSVDVMERDRMQDVLKEQGFQQSGACTDEGCMVEMGRLLGVGRMITGSIGKLGRLYLINVRAVDVQTAKIVAVVSKDIDGRIEEVVGLLPVIAAELVGGGEQPRQVPARAAETPAPRVPCEKPVLLVATAFSRENTGLELENEEFRELNEEVTEDMCEALDEALGDDDLVGIVGPTRLGTMADCEAVIVKVELHNYTVEPGGRSQFKGTADVTIGFYDGMGSGTLAFAARIKRTGDRHWGEYEPFENAFEEINEVIEDELDRKDYIKALRKRLR